MVFGLYTKKDLEREIEKQMIDMDQKRWLGERLDRIEKRLSKLEFQLKHGTDKLKVGEPIPVDAEDCCTTCCPCPEEDFG